MNFTDYKKHPAINASFIKACSFGPYQGWKYLHLPSYESVSMSLGTAVHCRLLEPLEFVKQYAVLEEKLDRRTKEGKEKFEAFTKLNAGKTVLSLEDWETIKRLSRRCEEIPEIKEALDTFEKEKTIIFSNGCDDMKARLDLVNLDSGVIIDIKTTRDASPKAFARDFLNMRYDLQLFHYAQAVAVTTRKKTTLYALALETESGEVAMYSVNDFVFNPMTEKKYKQALETARKVLTMKECPAKYPIEILELNMPEWAKEEIV